MELKEAEKIIKNSFLFKDANEHIQLKEAISTVLQSLENIAFKTKLAEGDLEILEKHSTNHWNDSFAYVEETVAVKNLRNRINDIEELLKGE